MRRSRVFLLVAGLLAVAALGEEAARKSGGGSVRADSHAKKQEAHEALKSAKAELKAEKAADHHHAEKAGSHREAHTDKKALREDLKAQKSLDEHRIISQMLPSVAGAPVAATGSLFNHPGRLLLLAAELALLIFFLCTPKQPESSDEQHLARKHQRVVATLAAVLSVEAAAHLLAPLPYLSVGLVIFLAVYFTISPLAHPYLPLQMGTVPPLCCAWLRITGVLSHEDCVRGLYGSEALRPYHLVVMFLGSVYLCTALERSGFLHTLACKVVERYGRSPWGLFWALGCFSGTLTVLIPDDIVTMTLTPVTIRMCQLLNLPEIPFLFSQFFAGNIWAVTLVTGNPTNVLLAEDLGDTFLSFAARMGVPGILAGLTSFFLMWLTNRTQVNAAVGGADGAAGRKQSFAYADEAGDALRGKDERTALSPRPREESGVVYSDADREDEPPTSPSPRHKRAAAVPSGTEAFTVMGSFCLVRLLVSALFCALDSVHGLPVYLCVLIIGVLSLATDACVDARFAKEVLVHMPWELLSFVTAFLVLAEAMATSGISLWLAAVFSPLVASRSVVFVSAYVTMLFCNLFETLPATLIVFKMIDSVPQWRPAAIAAAGLMKPVYTDARRAALSAVIFGSNFGANTSCIGSLGGLMMRRLALQQGVHVTNGLLLKQGIPVMLPVMFVACFALIQERTI